MAIRRSGFDDLAVFGVPIGEICRKPAGAQTIDDLVDFLFTDKGRAKNEETISSGAAVHQLDLGSGNARPVREQAGRAGIVIQPITLPLY